MDEHVHLVQAVTSESVSAAVFDRQSATVFDRRLHIDHSTVQEVVGDLRKRFDFGRIVFVGDRGMVTDENIEAITNDGHGFLVGLKRRRNPKLDAWLDAVDETKWIDCPG